MSENPIPGVVVEASDGVHVITINRPEKRNALDLADRLALIAAIEEAGATAECRAVVLRGEGAVFSAGGDVSSMGAGPEALPRLEAAVRLAEVIVELPKPVIAAVVGGAYGLGLSVVSCCDYVVAAEDATFVAAFGRIGLAPDTVITWALPRKVGYAKASEMLMWAEPVDATEMARCGLVNTVVPAEDVLETALARGRKASRLAPGSLAAVKTLLRTGSEESFRLRAEGENRIQLELFESANFAEGRAAFLERRKAVFVGE